MKKVYLETPEAVIKALKDGKEIKGTNGWSYKLVEGFIINTNGKSFYVGDNISNIYDPYILKEEPLKINVGKWYETRSHKKARCYKIKDDDCCFTIDGCGSFVTNKKGCFVEEEAHDLDIIGPWGKDKK